MKRVLAVLLSAVLSLSVAVVPGIQTLAEEPDALFYNSAKMTQFFQIIPKFF